MHSTESFGAHEFRSWGHSEAHEFGANTGNPQSQPSSERASVQARLQLLHAGAECHGTRCIVFSHGSVQLSRSYDTTWKVALALARAICRAISVDNLRLVNSRRRDKNEPVTAVPSRFANADSKAHMVSFPFCIHSECSPSPDSTCLALVVSALDRSSACHTAARCQHIFPMPHWLSRRLPPPGLHHLLAHPGGEFTMAGGEIGPDLDELTGTTANFEYRFYSCFMEFSELPRAWANTGTKNSIRSN